MRVHLIDVHLIITAQWANGHNFFHLFALRVITYLSLWPSVSTTCNCLQQFQSKTTVFDKISAMIGLSKLRSALTVVFAVSVVAILAQLFCVIRRRRRIRRQSVSGGEENSPYNPSKELFYFFCWKNQSRIEPQQAPSPSPPLRAGETADIDDILKWRGLYMYGPSRFLFTIEEEEREGVDSENCSSSEKGKTKSKRVITEERVAVVGVSSSLPVVAVTIDVDEATPFSTPCASPPYYTPLPSPTREMEPRT